MSSSSQMRKRWPSWKNSLIDEPSSRLTVNPNAETYLNWNGTRESTHFHQAEQFTFRIQLIGRIWTRTQTKIETACSWHLTNSSTKFCMNPSTTFWDVVLYIGLARSLKGEKSLKISSRRIRIRIFTRIESVRHGHTPNLSTKFCLNQSATFWDIMLCIVFGPISQWWRITF